MSRVDDLAHNISLRVPGFEAYWRIERSEDSDRFGPNTICGLFDSLASYLLDEMRDLDAFDSEPFWEWIGWQIESSDEEVSNSVVVCFLESIYDTEIEKRFRARMPGAVQAWIDNVARRKQRKK